MSRDDADYAAAVAKVDARRKLLIQRGDTIKTKPVSWLWERRIALGKITIIAGDPGLGKSQLALYIAARITRGEALPDGTPAPQGSVLIVSAEDDPEDTLLPRFLATGGEPSKLHVVKAALTVSSAGDVEKRMLSLRRDMGPIEDAILEIGDCRLLIIDPVTAYMDGTDDHKNANVRALFAPLAEMAQRTATSVIGISHFNKMSGGASAYRVTGSIAYIAAARAVYAVTKDEDDPTRRLFLPIKNNLGIDDNGFAYSIVSTDEEIPYLRWEPGLVYISAEEALNPDAGDERGAIDEAIDFLQDFLADGPVKASEGKKAAMGAGISERTLRRARGKIPVYTGKRGFTDGWYWSLYSLKPDPEDATKGAKEPEDVHPIGVAPLGNVGPLGSNQQ